MSGKALNLGSACPVEEMTVRWGWNRGNERETVGEEAGQSQWGPWGLAATVSKIH